MLNHAHHQNGVKELIQVDPGCPAFWVPFTAGTYLPDEAVKGGYLADSSTDLYVIRALQGDDGMTMFGYYKPEAAVGYVENWGGQEVIHVELLFLFWIFPNRIETEFFASDIYTPFYISLLAWQSKGHSTICLNEHTRLLTWPATFFMVCLNIHTEAIIVQQKYQPMSKQVCSVFVHNLAAEGRYL